MFCWFLNHSGPLYVDLCGVCVSGGARGFQCHATEDQEREDPNDTASHQAIAWSPARLVAGGHDRDSGSAGHRGARRRAGQRPHDRIPPDQSRLRPARQGAADRSRPGLAWGLAASPGTDAKPGSPLWVADNGSDKATLYTGATATSVNKAALVVGVTGAAPTGQVFNSAQSGFVVSDKQGHSGPSAFIFDTENGTIDGWNPAVGATGSSPSTVTEVARDNGANAVYKGLATAQASDGKTYLYATNFRSGRVEVLTTAPSHRCSCPAGCSWIRGSPWLRAVRHRRDQRQAGCDVRQAGRHAGP